MVGSKLTPDAVIGYDGALAMHGLTRLAHGITVISKSVVRHFHLNEVVYPTVLPGPIGS